MMPPVWWPNSALKLLVRTWNSRTASTPRTLPDALPAWLYSSFRFVPSRVNRFAVYRDPFTLNFAPNPVLVLWPPLWVSCTPGVRLASSTKLRPLSGSPSICAVEISPPVDADLVSTVLASATTVTSSDICPIFNPRLTTASWPTVRLMPLRSTVVNPSRVAFTLYGPGARSGAT